ncbi:hypothetical protein O181_034634 [Austropuccinia psidii MF-1]|uniref:Uncharacterized protein n=1 Tax=Austropuccinia psidii MF-1 TaxID=1389203 RepID=A0A9Q3H9R2_9BASI|nr:hypothetical protein [Austropuccinia psidii MF-1]
MPQDPSDYKFLCGNQSPILVDTNSFGDESLALSGTRGLYSAMPGHAHQFGWQPTTRQLNNSDPNHRCLPSSVNITTIMLFCKFIHPALRIFVGLLVRYSLQQSESSQASTIKTPNKVVEGFPIICREFSWDTPKRYCMDKLDHQWSCDPDYCVIFDGENTSYGLNPRKSNLVFMNCLGPPGSNSRPRIPRIRVNSYFEYGSNVVVADGFIGEKRFMDFVKMHYVCPIKGRSNAQRVACTVCESLGPKPKGPKG